MKCLPIWISPMTLLDFLAIVVAVVQHSRSKSVGTKGHQGLTYNYADRQDF